MKDSQLTAGQRLKIARTNAKLTQSELGEHINVKKAAIANIENGTNGLSWAYAHILCEPLGVSEEWLLTGEGETEQTANNQVEETQEDYIKAFVKRGDKRFELQAIPLYDITAAAGLAALHMSNNNILDYLSIPNLARCDGAIYIKGDSMYPLLKHGDIVAFQKINPVPDEIYFGELYVVDLSTPHLEKIVVKYVKESEKGPEYIQLYSYNEKHHPPKDVHLKRVRAMAEVKASIRLT